jgi:hypothetical protein
VSGRPIETAPKDGTQILVPVGHGLFNVVSWWDGGWREGTNGLRLANEPKHWFSLPKEASA